MLTLVLQLIFMEYKRNKDELIIFGYHSVMEAVAQQKPIQKVIIQNGDFNDHTRELWYQLKGGEIFIQRWPKEKIEKLVRGQNHQGIIAFISPVPFTELDDLVAQIYENGEVPKIAWLDGVTDVRNLGAIIRSAVGFGIHGLILPVKSGANLSGEVVKTSVGAIYQMPLIQSMHVQATIDNIKELGLSLVAISEKTEDAIAKLDNEEPICLVLGDEGKGIKREVMQQVDAHFSIPMQGELASLNVSVAAGIAFYELSKPSI